MADEVQVSLRGTAPLIALDIRGEVTTFADEAITSAYQAATQQGARYILFNFAAVDYINSSGISIIIGLLGEAREAEQGLMITGLTPHYRKIFDMMGLSRHAAVFDTEQDARRSLATN